MYLVKTNKKDCKKVLTKTERDDNIIKLSRKKWGSDKKNVKNFSEKTSEKVLTRERSMWYTL